MMNIKSNKIGMMLVMLLLAFTAMGQSILTGTVYETIDGKKEPCMGVNVAVVNAQNRLVAGVTTDVNGTYSIRMPGDANLTLLYSFIGLAPQRIPYKGQKTQDVLMSEDSKLLSEVVMTSQRVGVSELGVSERAFTGASQRIQMDEVMESLPVNSVEEALQGQLAGVDILTSGDPGAKGSIRIRGTATLNSNADPLIIINGVPYNTDIDDDFDFSTASTEDFADMLALNPSDIENIEVLKDAASTAIYGTKGANGVLMITTKKGTKGKPRFIFSHKSTLKIEPETIPMLTGNEYTAYMQDAIWNTANARGLNSSGAGELLDMLFSEKSYAIGYQPDWSYFDEYNVDTNWLSDIKKNAYSNDNNFSMSGGGEKATYRFSLGWTGEDGTTRNNDMSRLTSSLRIGYNFSDRMNVNADFTYSDTHNDQTYKNSSSLRSEAQRKMPNKSPYYIDDDTKEATDIYFTYQDDNEFQGAYTGSSNFHPIAMTDESFNNTNTKEEKITISPSYVIIQGDSKPILRYQGYVSMKFKTVKNRQFLPQEATGVDIESQYSNFSYDGYTNNFSLQSETKLLYNQNFDDMHELVGAFIWRTAQSAGSSYASQVYGVAANGMGDPVTGGTLYSGSLNSGTSDARTLSGIGNVNYTFMRWLTLNGTWNYEGNSALSRSNRWALFQSYGTALNLQDLEIIQSILPFWLSQSKLRFSWGQSGKAPSGTSPYVGTYTALSNKYGTAIPVVPNSMQLNKLKWETSEEWDIGADISLLEDRVKTTFDYYQKTPRDLLQRGVSVASTSAYSSIAYTNSGSMSNHGFEFRIDWRIHESKDWRWSMDFNINRNINTILDLPDNLAEDTYTFKNGVYAQKLVAGTPVGSFFGYRYDGVYQNLSDTYARDDEGNVMRDLNGNAIVMKNGTYICYPGDAKYQDINYDGTIDENDIVYLGNCNPMVTGGAGLNARYKSWSLSTRFHYRLGQKIINRARMNNEAMYNTDNQSKSVLRRWRSEGDDTDIPRALYNYGLNYLGSDRFVEDCSYIRLQTMSLSYRLPKKFSQRFKANNTSLFITGYDLFTLTNYKGQDPEVTLPNSVTGLAQDNSSTPRSRRFAMGITIDF